MFKAKLGSYASGGGGDSVAPSTVPTTLGSGPRIEGSVPACRLLSGELRT